MALEQWQTKLAQPWPAMRVKFTDGATNGTMVLEAFVQKDDGRLVRACLRCLRTLVAVHNVGGDTDWRCLICDNEAAR